MRDLLEKMMKFAGEKVGQKPGDQWRGSDKAPPGKKLVGDSILKDLSKGPNAKSKEQELAEEFQAFLEAEFKDTVDKRPGRKSDRPHRGHKEQPRYKTIKADESYMSEKDIELQDYRSMTNQEFQTAYGMSKMEWINQNKALVIQNPDLKRALGLEEGVADQIYTVDITRSRGMGPSTTRSTSGTMVELLDYFGYTLEVGKSYEHERGRYKINMNPRNINQLVDALNKAATNAAANSAPSTYYSVGESQVAEGVPYKATNPYPALQDPIIAKVVKQMRPGLGLVGLDLNNEAFLYYAYELGKQRAKDSWEHYYPAIRQAYMMDKSKQAKELDEGWESGPPEYKEPYDDADDAYDRRRQEKLDIEAEKANAKRPQEKVYTLLGRGPNMEPNYKFPGEYKSQEEAIAAREKIMADPNTPHPEHIGIHSYTRYLDQTNENSATTPQNPAHAKQMQQDLSQLQTDIPNPDPETQAAMINRKNILMKQAKALGIDESRAHKILDKWFKDRELQDKFARGELNIPTPQERRAELEKSKAKDKKQVKEYGANQPTGTAAPGKTVNDPKQAQAVAQATQAMKSATGSPAPTTTLAKALDTASQGKPVMGQEATALQPLMKDMATVAQDPKLAGSFKSLVNQINQAQLKQQQQK